MGISTNTNRGGAMAELNVVPLIDILLVLLIIFMVITPHIPKGLAAMIPQANNDRTNEAVDPGTIVVQVAPGGQVTINGEDSDWGRLGPRMDQIFKQRADKTAFVKGDDDVLFTDVARAVDIMRGAGVARIGLISSKLAQN
ncbi:MAG: protein TolR [Candidatus Acidiferrum sp.]